MTQSSQEKYIVPLASLTVVGYTVLALVSAWFYKKFARICDHNNQGHLGRSNIGKFDEAKSWFFLLLMLSSIADIPLYIGCIAKGGPHDCEWNGASYAVFWFLHLCAVCGYAYTIIIPCLLWSDMINRKDGKLFTSKYPPDRTKRFFQISLISYILLTICDLIFGGIYYQVSNHSEYLGTMFSMMCSLLEPICICSIALGCLWCGIRLQMYVRQAKLGLRTEIRFLVHMNITMAVITSTYLARGVLILRLVAFLPESFRSRLETSYFVWLLCTRWLPYIFCSFCLIAMMRASGEEVAQRGAQRSKVSTNSSDSALQLDESTVDNSTSMTQRLSSFTGHRRAYTAAGYHGSAQDGDFSGQSSTLLSQRDYNDDDAYRESTFSILTDHVMDDPDMYMRSISSVSSNPAMDIMTSTPDVGPFNSRIPPPSNSSMATGYSPPNPNTHNMWAQLRSHSPMGQTRTTSTGDSVATKALF
jgi:hypothetical protein